MKNELCRLCHFLNKSTVLGTCQAFLMREAFHVLHNNRSMLWRWAGHVEVCSNSFWWIRWETCDLGKGHIYVWVLILTLTSQLFFLLVDLLFLRINTFTVYSEVYYSEALNFLLISWNSSWLDPNHAKREPLSNFALSWAIWRWVREPVWAWILSSWP